MQRAPSGDFCAAGASLSNLHASSRQRQARSRGAGLHRRSRAHRLACLPVGLPEISAAHGGKRLVCAHEKPGVFSPDRRARRTGGLPCGDDRAGGPARAVEDRTRQRGRLRARVRLPRSGRGHGQAHAGTDGRARRGDRRGFHGGPRRGRPRGPPHQVQADGQDAGARPTRQTPQALRRSRAARPGRRRRRAARRGDRPGGRQGPR
jgi:hypothetical protein